MIDGVAEPLRDAIGVAALVTEPVALGEAEGAAAREVPAEAVRVPVAAPVVEGVAEREAAPVTLREDCADAVREAKAEAVAQAVPAGPQGSQTVYAYHEPLVVYPKVDLK